MPRRSTVILASAVRGISAIRPLSLSLGAAMSNLVRDRVDQGAEASDLHLAGVAGLHPELRLAPPADAGRGARQHDVAGLEGEGLAEEGDTGGDVEDQLASVAVLDDFTVEPGRDLQPLGAGRDLVGGDE